MPHFGYTDGMEARYTIKYNPASELYTCKWESAVMINGLYHIIHYITEIPSNVNHETWVKAHNLLALEELEKAYITLEHANISNY